jgi:hypothetical protein
MKTMMKVVFCMMVPERNLRGGFVTKKVILLKKILKMSMEHQSFVLNRSQACCTFCYLHVFGAFLKEWGFSTGGFFPLRPFWELSFEDEAGGPTQRKDQHENLSCLEGTSIWSNSLWSCKSGCRLAFSTSPCGGDLCIALSYRMMQALEWLTTNYY